MNPFQQDTYQNRRQRAAANQGQFYRGYYSDPIRETGLARNESKSIMYAASIAKPAEYNQMRQKLTRDLTWQLTQNMYDVIYAALSQGKLPDNTYLINFGIGAGDNGIDVKYNNGRRHYEPVLPEAEVNKIAYRAATSLIKIMNDEVVDVLCPANFTKLANEQIQSQVKTKIAGGEYDA
jgi:hypothetical protein